MPAKSVPRVVQNTMQISIIAQIVSIAIAIYVLTTQQRNQTTIQTTKHEHKHALATLITVELVASLIQTISYSTVLRQSDIGQMALRRYYDWVFTTPIMLFTNMAYMEYIAQGRPTDFSVKNFAMENKSIIAFIMFTNFLMLFFGIMGEAGIIPMIFALVLGFAAFFVTFFTLWRGFARKSHEGRVLFTFFVTVWSAYGVAFVMPNVLKNVFLNCIDIISKNMFLVFLSLQYMKSNKSQ